MTYQINRKGQSYGPYTLDELERYLASGNVLPTDLAKSEDMAEWVPVSQLLGSGAPPLTDVPLVAAPLPVSSSYPPPPNLHWALVLVFSMFCSFFLLVWLFVQAAWLRRVEPKSAAMGYYLGAVIALVLGGALAVATSGEVLPGLMVVIYVVLLIVGLFSMKASLEEHYNRAEPIGLRLSPVMSFVFSAIYFQYHFNRINEARLAARYAAPRSQ